jgi:dihydropyrimidinase
LTHQRQRFLSVTLIEVAGRLAGEHHERPAFIDIVVESVWRFGQSCRFSIANPQRSPQSSTCGVGMRVAETADKILRQGVLMTVLRAATAGGAAIALALFTSVAAQQPAELLVRNGLIVTSTSRTQGDLRVRNGTIVEIGRNLSAAAGSRVIDATGKLILPGGVDPHVHLLGAPRAGADDYTTASRAALAGGVTTIGNFINQVPTEDLVTTLKNATGLVKTQAIADIVLHAVVSDPLTVTPEAMATLARGFTLKIFTSRPQFDGNLPEFMKLIESAGKAGVLTMLHCEDAATNQMMIARLMAQGLSSIKYFPESRPVVSEEVATQRCAAISEATGAPIYVVHLSSERALRVVEAAQARGLPVFVETRILYLHLTRERFERPDANIYTGVPPLREPSDKAALWKGVARGSIHVIATDHVSYTRAEKMDPAVDITNVKAAGNYLQVNLPLLYSEGVRGKKITLEQMVAETSTNPAKLFGLYPKKGTIAVGSDADLAIWDPNLKRTVTDEEQFSNAKFSIFTGWEITGWPIVTIRRGEVVYEGGQIVAEPGSGRLAPRTHWQKP